MKPRTLLITLFFTLGFTLQNCIQVLDCNFDPVPEFFDITGMSILHMDASRKIIDTSSISLGNYRSIVLSFEVDFVVHQELLKPNFSLMNAAYGCDPPVPGTQGSKEEAFDNITVITLYDFDENHSASDTINDVLWVEGINPIPDDSLEAFLEMEKGNVSSERLELRFISSPKVDQEFQVKIIVDLSTGESFEATSEAIFFTP